MRLVQVMQYAGPAVQHVGLDDLHRVVAAEAAREALRASFQEIEA